MKYSIHLRTERQKAEHVFGRNNALYPRLGASVGRGLGSTYTGAVECTVRSAEFLEKKGGLERIGGTNRSDQARRPAPAKGLPWTRST